MFSTLPSLNLGRWTVALTGALLLSVAAPRAEADLIFADNFNAPNSDNLDNSDQTGRRSGLLASDVQVRSAMIQHGIVDNQLNFLPTPTGPGRIRFQGAADWWNFASGAAGAEILADGGLRIEFDWIPADNTSDNWISVNIGFSGSTAGEPPFRVNDPQTDFGMLFRNAGGTQFFDNGVPVGGSSFDVSTLGSRHVSLIYSFGSFADGTNVLVSAFVNGVETLSKQAFQWDNNSGALHLELGALAAGTRIDNLVLTSIPEPSTFGLLGTAGVALALRRRRRE